MGETDDRNRGRAPLTLDGAMGEGGGQILRTALSLSMCLQRPFEMVNIRVRRRNPGLQRQHLAAVHAAAAVSRAEVSGAELGSRHLSFIPRGILPGDHRFDIGTAGSTTLVLQTVLPALLGAEAPARIRLVGGTHNPMAPPFEFIEQVFLPLIRRMGAQVEARLMRPGFYPAGGGEIEVTVNPAGSLAPLELTQRGGILEMSACALISHLPGHIAERELGVIGAGLGIAPEGRALRRVDAYGPGNVVYVRVASEQVTELFTGFGQRGVRAEAVAEGVVAAVRRYLVAGVPVGEHLADQLLLPLALAGRGVFVTLRPSPHTLTNIEVIRRFMPVAIACEPLGEDACRVTVRAEDS